jgi:ferredoxin
MKITTDKHLCVGAGRCAAIAPALFGQSDEDGLVVLLRDEAATDQEKADAAEARESCPSLAIRLEG